MSNQNDHATTPTIQALEQVLQMIQAYHVVQDEKCALIREMELTHDALERLAEVIGLGLNTSCQDCDRWHQKAREVLQSCAPWLGEEKLKTLLFFLPETRN